MFGPSTFQGSRFFFECQPSFLRGLAPVVATFAPRGTLGCEYGVRSGLKKGPLARPACSIAINKNRSSVGVTLAAPTELEISNTLHFYKRATATPFMSISRRQQYRGPYMNHGLDFPKP
jgi:hypothetical protein